MNNSIWILQKPGQYDMRRTSKKEQGAVEYVQAEDYNELLAWAQKQIDSSDDATRLSWLANRDNDIGNVQLPTECVSRNLHSLRDAIDDAMNLTKQPNG